MEGTTKVYMKTQPEDQAKDSLIFPPTGRPMHQERDGKATSDSNTDRATRQV